MGLLRLGLTIQQKSRAILELFGPEEFSKKFRKICMVKVQVGHVWGLNLEEKVQET